MTTQVEQGDQLDLQERLARQRDHAREHAAHLRRDLLAVFAASDTANLDDEHDPEGATVAYERQFLIDRLAAIDTTLDEIAEAESRLDNGTYGRCATCDGAITSERLRALPTTTCCIECARAR
jgi:DnaK suppressor protein